MSEPRAGVARIAAIILRVHDVAHYLIQAGYPTDRPAHLRRISEGLAAKRGARS